MKSKRNAIVCSVILVMMISITMTLFACSESHTHTFGDWEEYKKATCTEAGENRRYCSVCGEYESEPTAITDHTYGSWAVVKAPTCTVDGERQRKCENCTHFESEVIPAAHDWVLVKTNKAATCEEPGEGEYMCSVCENTKTDEIPNAGHTWDVKRTKEPTCETPGEDTKTCSVCKTVVTESVPAKGHLWRDESVAEPATCEGTGKMNQKCANCSSTRQTDIRALGHAFSSEFTVDEGATFDAPGEKSRHCLRSNCNGRTEVTVIPKLEENTPIDYTFKLLLNNGTSVTFPDAVITVKDKQGNQVAQSDRNKGDIKNGTYTVSLLPREYTVSVSGLSKGYKAEDKYDVSYLDPLCKMWIGASPIQDERPSGLRYSVGDVMYDFTLETVAKKTITLSEILQKKKLVVIDFFYVHCTFCDVQFPGVQAVYERYSDQIEVIGIDNPSANSDTAQSIQAYGGELGLTLPLCLDTSLALHTNFGVRGYPFTVIIDQEGVVVYTHEGALTTVKSEVERVFEDLIKNYLSDDYWKNPAKKSNPAPTSKSISLPEAILPSDNGNGKKKD